MYVPILGQCPSDAFTVSGGDRAELRHQPSLASRACRPCARQARVSLPGAWHIFSYAVPKRVQPQSVKTNWLSNTRATEAGPVVSSLVQL